jgi:hypothetical protein
MIYTPSPCLKGIDNMLFTLLTVEKKKAQSCIPGSVK